MPDQRRNSFLCLIAVACLCFPPVFAETSSSDEKQKPILEQSFLHSDSRKSDSTWNEFFWSKQGLLKNKTSYSISFDYKVEGRTPATGFYSLIRSKKGKVADQSWQNFGTDAKTSGSILMNFTAGSDDSYLIIGIKNKGVVSIRNLKIVASDNSVAASQGPGWVELPVDTDTKSIPLPPQIAGAHDFNIDAPNNPNGPVINLAEFGLVADEESVTQGKDRNLLALNDALAKCREVKASKLIVPKGVYRISSGSTLKFEKLRDFTFDGGGATFLFDQIKGGAGVSISDCTRTVFSNFNLDWDWRKDPLASVGRITAVARDSSYFEMRFETPARLDPKRWETLTPLDEKLRVPGKGMEISNYNPTKIESLDARTVRVYPSYHVTPKVGQLYQLRHYMYEKHAMVISNNAHQTIQDVNLFSFPGEGFVVGGDQHHFELKHCSIVKKRDEHHTLSLTADGVHIGHSQGFIKIEDCDFGNMGDDCINLHDVTHAGVKKIDTNTLLAVGIVAWACPFSEGDPVEIRQANFAPTGYTGRVKQAQADYKSKTVTLTFDKELPGNVDPNSILFNHRYHCDNYIIRNCYLHDNRGRGILAKANAGLIEGNRFVHNQMAAMQLEADVDSNWDEGYGARNLILRNNTYDRPNSHLVGNGAVIFISATVNGHATGYPLLENIMFESNIFENFTGPIIDAKSFKNLVFQNNEIRQPGKVADATKTAGWIKAELGQGLWLEGNTWTYGSSQEPPHILYDRTTTKEVVVQKNHIEN